MKRNQNSMFAINPTNLDRPRSTFNRPSRLLTSFNVGELIPIFCDEVYPGDTHKFDTSMLLRTSSPFAVPPMDDLFIDTYYFFVPGRLVWSHWVNFFGENTESAWVPTTTYTIPQITSPASTGWQVHTLADYFGVPTGVAGLSINALPFRAYALIYNNYFRDENLCDPINYNLDDATVTGVNDTTYSNPIANCVLGGCPMKVAKYHDYFTSALPNAQKGPAVSLPLGDDAVVYYGNDGLSSSYPPNSEFVDKQAILVTLDGLNDNVYAALGGNRNIHTSNSLYADLSSATATTINELREAFQLQKYYETLARGGSRYPEWLKAMFGVTSPDARQQRPEYLGGERVRIGINQVVQTSGNLTEAGKTQYQGRQSAYSVTSSSGHAFTKSFTEHGYLIGVCCIRYKHTYQNGLNRMWSRREVTDFYNPLFANLGEQAILNKEIYAQGTATDNEAFGYQEAWADLRYKPNQITGEMRSSYATSLDVYHFGDDYNSLPSLSAGWIVEDKASVDRALYVNSSVSNQFVADFYFNDKATRVMPLFSIPGLIDHH